MTPNERLKKEIDLQGRKCSWVAQQANMSASTLSEIINNKRNLTAVEIITFCGILGIPASKIVPTKYDTQNTEVVNDSA